MVGKDSIMCIFVLFYKFPKCVKLIMEKKQDFSILIGLFLYKVKPLLKPLVMHLSCHFLTSIRLVAA